MASSAAFELILELKDHASKGLGQAAQQGGFLKNALSFAAGGAILGGITAIGKAAGDMFGDAIGEAKEWNTQIAQVDAVLASTGGKAGITKDAILELNKSLSAGGGFSAAADDAVLSGQNMLLTFTNIGKDVFPEASKAMLDMATKMNGGVTPGADQLAQTSIQLGKALNDPIKGVGALSKVGVTFTEQQKEQIKTMVAAGDTMGAQKLILAELNTEFGGSATAAMSTFEGQQQLVAEQFNNMKQTVGEALMPVLSGLMGFVSTTLMPIFQGMADGISKVVGWFTQMAEGATSISEVLFNMAENVEGPLGPILGFFSSIVENVERFIQAIQAGESPIDAFFKLIGDNFQAIGGLWDRLGPMLGELAGNILAWLGDMVPKLVTKLGEWGGALIQWVMDSLPGWLQKAGEFMGSVLAWIGEQLPPLLAKLAEWGGAFVGWVMESLPGWLAAAGEFIGGVLAWLVEQIPVIVAKLAEWAGAFIGWIVPQIPGMLLKLGEFLLAIGTWILTEALPAIVSKLVEWGGAFLNWIAKDVLPFIGGKLAEVWTAITGWIGTTAASIVTEIAKFATSFWTWITDVVNNIGAKLGEIWTKITTWVTDTATNIVNTVKSIGTGIIDGIKAGISGAWDAFVSWIGQQLTGFIDGIKSFFGISSPSQMMYDEVGMPLVQGMAAGWNAAWPGWEGGVRSNMERLAGEVSGRAAQIAAMMNNLQMSGSATSSGTGASMWQASSTAGGGTGGIGGIHALASGGIVRRPVRAIVGEGGPEAVVPLDRLERWMGGSGGRPTFVANFYGPVYADEQSMVERIAEQLYDLTKGR